MRCQLLIIALAVSQAYGNRHSSRFEDFLVKVQAPFYDALLNFEVVVNLTVQLQTKLKSAYAEDPFLWFYENDYDLEEEAQTKNPVGEFPEEKLTDLETVKSTTNSPAKQLFETLPFIEYAINATHASLMSATAITESHRKQCDDTIANILQQIQGVERDISQKSREISTLNAEKRALQNEVNNLRNDVHREQRNLDHARNELHKHERELKKRKKEKKIWIWVNVFFPPAGFGLIPNAKDIDRAKSRIRNAEAVLRQAEQSFHGANTRLSQKETRVRSVEQSLQTAQAKQRDLTIRLNELKTESNVTTQFESKLKTLKPFLMDFASKIEYILEQNLLRGAFELSISVFDEVLQLFDKNTKLSVFISPMTRVLEHIRHVLSVAD